MRDLTGLIDVDVETLMKQAGTSDRSYYEDELRKRQVSRTLPFDARNEVSADARFIAGRVITQLWIVFVGVPVVVGLLYVLFTMR